MIARTTQTEQCNLYTIDNELTYKAPSYIQQTPKVKNHKSFNKK